MKGLTRRSVLIGSLASVSGKAAGQVIAVEIDISCLTEGDIRMIERADRRLAVRRLSHDEYLVLDGHCTHLGCSLKAFASARFAFRCFCHGSQFDAEGRVLRGPAERPLAAYHYCRISDTTIRVFLPHA